MTTTDPTEPEPDFFHDSYDRLLSSTTCSSSSSCSEIEDNNNNIYDDVTTGCCYSLAIPKFPIGLVNNYDVWISSPSSVDERRLRLLRRMGLGRKTPNYSIIRSKSADHECSSDSNKQCDDISREIVRVADTVTISSVSNSNEGEEVCTIRNLDNGKEFVVDEGKVKEVETGRRLTMEEFEMCVGRSPIVQELMRRENVEAACGGDECLRGEDSGNGNVNGSRVKKKSGWFKSIKNVASSVAGFKERRSSDERDTSSERGGRRSSSATDDSQDAAFHCPERVRVRQYGKSCKDLSALYKSQEIHAHNGSIWTIKFSLDGKYLASAGEDCLIHIWQVGSSDRKGELLFDKQEDVNLNVLLLTNGSPELGMGSPNLDMVPEKKRRGRLSISRKSTSLDHIVVPETIFALSEKPVCSFTGHLADVLDLSWSKSQHLLSSSMDKTVRLWDLSSQSCLKIFSHNDYVTCIQFNPVDDRYFISGSLDAKVRIWSIPDHQVVDWNDMHEMVTAACYTPDGQAALVGSYKGSCCLYNTTENKLQEKSRIDLQNKKKSRHKKITGFQFAPGTASEVLITSADSRIRVVDGADLVHKFKGFRNTNRQISAALTANGRYVVCASEDSQVYVWKHEGDTRPSRKKGITVAHSYEHFHCQDISVAIPWPGKNDTSCGFQDGFSRESSRPSGDHLDDVLAVNHPPTPEDQVYGKDRFPLGSGCTSSSPFHGIIKSNIPLHTQAHTFFTAHIQFIFITISSHNLPTNHMKKLGSFSPKRSSSSFIAHYPSPSRFASPSPSRSLSDSVMAQTLGAAEPLIVKWDPEASSYAKVTSLFYENRREAIEFIKLVNKLHKSMHAIVTENSNSELLVRAQHLMQIAVKRLQKEFYQMLSLNRAQLDPESVSTRSSRTSATSSLSDFIDESDDEIRVAEELISGVEDDAEGVMTDLRLIAECMISSGYGRECVKIYKIIRKSIVDEGIYKLGVEKMKPTRVHKMDFEVLELKIKDWLNAVNIAVKTLFHGERILCDQVFASSDSIRESCYSEITKEGASILFSFPENVVKNSKKSPQRIFRSLDMYTAIAARWPEITSIFSFPSTSPVVDQALSSLIKLAESVRSDLTEFETSLHNESLKTTIANASVHKFTIETMNYLTLLSDYGVLSDILFDSPPPEKSLMPETFFDKSYFENSPSPAASLWLAWLIFVLICKLDGKSEHYKEVSHSYIFLANNLQHIVSKVQSSDLRYLLGEDWIMKRESEVKKFSASYEKLAWSHVIDAVPKNNTTISTEEAKDRFKRITLAFEECHKKQLAVVIPDGKLRDEIKVSVARKLLPLYREFYNKKSSELRNDKKFFGAVKYAPEDMSNALSNLFFGSGYGSTSTSISSSSESRTSFSH